MEVLRNICKLFSCKAKPFIGIKVQMGRDYAQHYYRNEKVGSLCCSRDPKCTAEYSKISYDDNGDSGLYYKVLKLKQQFLNYFLILMKIWPIQATVEELMQHLSAMLCYIHWTLILRHALEQNKIMARIEVEWSLFLLKIYIVTNKHNIK